MFDRKYSLLAHLDMSLASCEPCGWLCSSFSLCYSRKLQLLSYCQQESVTFQDWRANGQSSAAAAVLTPPLSPPLRGLLPPPGQRASLRRRCIPAEGCSRGARPLTLPTATSVTLGLSYLNDTDRLCSHL